LPIAQHGSWIRVDDRAKAMVAVPWVMRFPLMPSISQKGIVKFVKKCGLQALLDFTDSKVFNLLRPPLWIAPNKLPRKKYFLVIF